VLVVVIHKPRYNRKKCPKNWPAKTIAKVFEKMVGKDFDKRLTIFQKKLEVHPPLVSFFILKCGRCQKLEQSLLLSRA
jgi:hypothetical protein